MADAIPKDDSEIIATTRPVFREAGDTPVIDFKNVSKTFKLPGTWPWDPVRDIHAVIDTSFTVAQGEVVALVGQSGSGKTTVSRCVLGLEEITSGEVLIEGHAWHNLSERERRALRVKYQYIPQDALSALDPQQTALETVTESLKVLLGLTYDQAHEKAKAMLTDLGLGARFGALPREMSGGEQRRVTLARVLALEPALIVADEPTSGLDADRQEQVLEDMINNLPERAGCLFITHDMAQARNWCHRALVMLEGAVVEELIFPKDEPQHPYSRMLFDPWGVDDLSLSTTT